MDENAPRRLLLVEDEARLRGLISVFLRMERFEVVEAEDGISGVERHADSGPFDLVIADLDLPKLPGIEVCRRIKSSQPSQPILVCSGAILGPHFAALEGLGIDRILTKPYLPARLLQEIDGATRMPPVHGPTRGSRGLSTGDPRWRKGLPHSAEALPHSLVKPAKSQ